MKYAPPWQQPTAKTTIQINRIPPGKKLMKRRGYTILEALVAAILLGAAGVVAIHMLVATTASGHKTELRRLATREAANVMERVMALPDDQLTPEAVGRLALSPQAEKALPGAKLAVRLDPQADPGPPATRVTVELVWKSHAGEPASPLRLLAWRFSPEEAAP